MFKQYTCSNSIRPFLRYDCWAVGVDADPYTCKDGFTVVMTGEKAKFLYQGVTYDIAEFNCCGVRGSGVNGHSDGFGGFGEFGRFRVF